MNTETKKFLKKNQNTQPKNQHLGFATPSLFKQIAIFPTAFLPLLDKELSRSRHEMTSSVQHSTQTKGTKHWAAVLK